MTTMVRFGKRHCCACEGVCHHVGAPSFCELHRPPQVAHFPSPPAPVLDPGQSVRIGGKPCQSQVQAILGFVEPTWIPCGLVEGHEGRHSFHIEWSES